MEFVTSIVGDHLQTLEMIMMTEVGKRGKGVGADEIEGKRRGEPTTMYTVHVEGEG